MIRLLLVRHAHAGDRGAWVGADAERPLSPRGTAQAAGLAAVVAPLLEGTVPDLATSPAARCSATIAPLAAHLGVDVMTATWLAEGSSGPALRRRIADLRRSAVWCSHGDVIPGLLMAIAGDGVDLGSDPRCRKGSVWSLDVVDGAVTGARYLPPPGA